jgi:hypothetical protein
LFAYFPPDRLLGTPGCVGIRFYFGYSAAPAHPPERFASVIAAVDSNDETLGVFAESGKRFPSMEGGIFE